MKHTKNPIILIAVILLAGAGATLVAFRLFADKPPRPEMIGERFYDPQLKLAYNPPARWRVALAGQELTERFASSRLIAHFEGPNPGDQADLIVSKSSDSLRKVRGQTLYAQRKVEKRVFGDEFTYLNAVPSWVYEYLAKEGPIMVYTFYVILDRNDSKITLLCRALPKSMAEQRTCVLQSINSIKLE